MIGHPDVIEHREDVSRFMIHLTRDDSNEWKGGGGTARQNFLDIYRQRTILALRAHCLHAWKMTSSQEMKCRVACFSAMPLSSIKHIAKPIQCRQIGLEPYGFVFKRNFIIEKGGQEVTNVNSYAGNDAVRASYDRAFEIAAKNNFTGKLWRQLPFVSAMNERYDFFWEREWRVLGNVEFIYSDLVCVILPEDSNGPLKFGLAQKGISWISPEWGLERIVEELADQQKRTRRLNPQAVKQVTQRRFSNA
ncbi:MAG TPA: hypothetical protein VMJ32_10355 [Pirellulales bacterium]|nr:hypothetical protein [Pirellulales bacterium]